MTIYDFYVQASLNSDLSNHTDQKFQEFFKLRTGFVKDKNKELDNFKNEIKYNGKKYSIGDINKIKQISGIYTKEKLQDLQNYINKLPKYSFAIWIKFKLKAPYFSKDENEFYIIQNPITKETNFKVPMIKPSSWKGYLASAFRNLINEEPNSNTKREKVESFLRIFGAGSESIKTIENYITGESKALKKTKEKLVEFLLFELGLEVSREDLNKINNIQNKTQLFEFIKNKLSIKLNNSQKSLPLEFQTHKGRAIFYPTYFDKLSLEIINPHDRKKRAGINPIHYEIVPENTEGIFQLIYIPFNAILKSKEEVKKEAQEDLENLSKALGILAEKGIGAKTKLGWGRFEIIDKKVCLNSDLKIPQEWEKCEKN